MLRDLLASFSLYPVATMRDLAAYLRRTRGSLYAPFYTDSGDISPALIRRAMRLNYITRCGEMLFLTDSGINAALTT